MSYVIAAPEMIASAASDVANIGSILNAANAAAAVPTVAVLPAAADEVSGSIANLFSAHAADYQALAGRAAAFHEQFMQNMTAGAASYVSAEATTVTSLMGTGAANAPLQSLNGVATRLAAALGLPPVTNPVPGDPDFMSQTTNFGGLFSTTSLADPDDNFFVATRFVSPLFTAAATSGFEPTVGLGTPGQTILRFQSPVAPFLNSSIALPFTDPIAPLFTALLPLGL